eukprot:g8905.t1
MMKVTLVVLLGLFLRCGHGLQHSSMWSIDGKSGAGWADMTFAVGDLAVIQNNSDLYEMKALYPLQWTVAQKQKCFAPVKHQQTSPDGYFSCIMLDPDYKASWKKQFATLQPLIKKGILFGIFLGDEHLYFGVTLAEVKTIADLIRTDWPEATIYMNEAPDIAACGMDKQNRTVFSENECFPQNVDWFGFDFYSHDSSSWRVPETTYKYRIYPRLSRPDQRVVPVSGGWSSGSLTRQEALDLDEFCTNNARAFFEFGLSDNRVVALFPFYWNGGAVNNPNGSITGAAGIKNLKRCAQTYRGMGEMIIAAGPEGTSLDPVHNPPRPNEKGEYPEPQCKSPVMKPPSTWPFCRRTNP